jgi:hypothetical protein
VQSVRDGAQQMVARRVTKRVVDVLEPIEVELQDRDQRPIAPGLRERMSSRM